MFTPISCIVFMKGSDTLPKVKGCLSSSQLLAPAIRTWAQSAPTRSTAEAFGAVEALEGSTGQAIQKLSSGRMRLLGEDRPTALQQTVAEWQLGDPVSTRDSFRPWLRRNRSQRPKTERIDVS